MSSEFQKDLAAVRRLFGFAYQPGLPALAARIAAHTGWLPPAAVSLDRDLARTVVHRFLAERRDDYVQQLTEVIKERKKLALQEALKQGKSRREEKLRRKEARRLKRAEAEAQERAKRHAWILKQARSDPTGWRDKTLRKKYGITAADYARLFDEQGGVCKVCKKPPTGNRRLAVDHDHATGKVRGLVHSKCNSGIGMLGDTLAGVLNAVTYLQDSHALQTT